MGQAMKRGPKPFDDDVLYLLRMAELRFHEDLTMWGAARRVLDDKLRGNSDYAKAKCLYKKYEVKYRNVTNYAALIDARNASIQLQIRKFSAKEERRKQQILEYRRNSVNLDPKYVQKGRKGRNYVQKGRKDQN
jgi:hypothetical protein